MIDFEQESLYRQKSMVSIKVIGVGGAGGNAVNSIISSGCQGIGFIVINTDAQALELSKAQCKIQIGVKSTKGLGAGANPEIGKRAAEEDLDKVMDALDGADIVFIVGGMGGGTGSGGLPVVARALREKGILSIAIVTKPFLFEGKRRAGVAQAAIEKLKQDVDTLIVVPNQKLLEVADPNVSMIDAFAMINEGVLSQSVRGLSDIITKPGHINVDFADIRTIMKDRGLAVMGTGRASGPDRARQAAMQAISSPLLENMSVVGAHGVLFNITGGKNLGLHEISEAASVIYQQAHEDANIIIGSVIDENLQDEVIVTIIATEFSRPALQETRNNAEFVQPASAVQSVACSDPAPIAAQPHVEEVIKVEVAEHHVKPLPIYHSIEQAEAYEAASKKAESSDSYDSFDLSADLSAVALAKVEASAKEDRYSVDIDLTDLDIPSFMRQKND